MTPQPPPDVIEQDATDAEVLDAQERETEQQAYDETRRSGTIPSVDDEHTAEDGLFDDEPADDEGGGGAYRIVTLVFVTDEPVATAWQRAHGLIESASNKNMRLADGSVEDAEFGA